MNNFSVPNTTSYGLSGIKGMNDFASSFDRNQQKKKEQQQAIAGSPSRNLFQLQEPIDMNDFLSGIQGLTNTKGLVNSQDWPLMNQNQLQVQDDNRNNNNYNDLFSL
jgi:hypothetical protein